MPRNPDLFRRMYGEPQPPPPRSETTGVLPAFWLVGLMVAFGCSLAVALGVLLVTAASGISDLERWGVITPDELLLAVHDHSPAHDGSAGCVVTGPRVVRWDDRKATASVALAGAEVESDRAGVRVTNGATVDCPFAPGEDSSLFLLTARQWAARPTR